MMESVSEKPGLRRHAWVIHLLVTGLQALSGIYLITMPDERSLGILSAGFALLGVFLSIGALRNQRDYAWTAMWFYPITYAAVGVSILLGGNTGIGVYYLALGVLGALAQAMAAPLFR
ncbi:MAG: hypothetical protein ACLFWD_05265 [Anaerolineales bacterium]